jgi:CheY-like chemotaxis protein
MANILLIDDDESLRDMVQQMLELDGHTVTTAEDGEAGLREFGTRGIRFDLVISDILMPKMDGARLIGELRNITQRMPILAMSGGRRSISSSFSLETATLSGASLRLSKPFTRAELQVAVKKLLAA